MLKEYPGDRHVAVTWDGIPAVARVTRYRGEWQRQINVFVESAQQGLFDTEYDEGIIFELAPGELEKLLC